MEIVNIASPDKDFIRQVEEESGQTVSKCYQCGNCTAGCPMAFAYDFQVNRLMRLIQAGQKRTVLSAKALWYCASCETCTVRCPNDIDVAAVMDVCRNMAGREKYPGVWRMRVFARAFLESVRLFGRSHELGIMSAFMAFTGRIFTDADLVPRILPKRKLLLKPHTIKARREVADIFRRFKESPRKEGRGNEQ